MGEEGATSEALFARIPIVKNLVDVRDVPVPHTNQAVYSLDVTGRRWVRKREENTGCEELLAEIIGWLLGRAIDAPVPDGAVYEGPEGRSWLSAVVEDVVHWDPKFSSRVTNLDGLGATLALDAVILNPDRHAGNLLVQPIDAVSVHVWAIDHGQALVGWPDDFVASAGETPEIRNLLRGLPVDILVAATQEAAEKATQIPRQAIMSMVRGACLVTGEPRADDLGRALVARCADATTLVNAYLYRIRESWR